MFGMKPFKYLTKPVRILLILNAIVFVLQLLGGNVLEQKIIAYGALIPAFLTEPWRFVTYAFIHGGFFHFLFNMMILWSFGDEVSEYLGEKKFVLLYATSGILAGIFSVPFYLFGALSPYACIIGASGALMGIFVAYYKLFPDRMLLMFFVIPMKMKYAIWVMVVMDVLLSRTNDSIAHFTHLGGLLAGFIFMALFNKQKTFSRKRKRKNTNPDILEGDISYIDPQKQLDEILKKVKEEGIQSLTPSEKEYLLKVSEKMRSRRF